METYSKTRQSGVHRLQYLKSSVANPEVITYSPQSWTNVLNGVKNPNWKAQVAIGSNATTPMSATSVACEHSDGHVQIEGQAFGNPGPMWAQHYHRKGWIKMLAIQGPATIFLNNTADSQAAGNFYKRARQAQTAFEGGVFVLELLKTAKMVRSRLADMVGLCNPLNDKLRRRARDWRKRSKLSRLRDCGQLYLEFKFGWDQLARDIHSISDPLTKPYEVWKVVSGAGSSTSEVTSGSSNEIIGPLTYDSNFVGRSTQKVRYKGAVKVARFGALGLAQGYGLLPSNFIPTLYEVVPWSFLVDYVTNVGDIINASCFLRSDLVWYCRNIHNTSVFDHLVGVNARAAGTLVGVQHQLIAVPQRTRYTTKYVQRDAVAPPVPGLVFKIPNVADKGGAQQAANVAALLAAKGLAQSTTSPYR